jgi:hypothetical protein
MFPSPPNKKIAWKLRNLDEPLKFKVDLILEYKPSDLKSSSF